MWVDRVFSFFTSDIAIDLGTANTLIYVKGEGIVANEPSVVAVQKDSRGAKAVLAVGKAAKEMIGKAPINIEVIRPLKDGVIADFDVAQQMIRYFIKHAYKKGSFIKPRIAIGVPYGITEVEKRTVKEAAASAGAREVFLVEQPMAAAVGAHLPVTEPTGNMIVDIGGGTTEVAVMSMGGVVVSRSLRVAGDEMDQDIVKYVREKYNVLIGERVAEQVKWSIGSAFPMPVEKTIEVRGRNLINGLPESVEISSVEVREALSSSVQVIVDTIKDALDEVPPEIVADLMDIGICLAGGGALLQGLADRLSDELNLRVWVAEDPLTCVVRGTGMILEDFEGLKNYLVGLERGSTRHN